MKDNTKCNEWERRRRDKLNDAFNSLAQLLPFYDPAKTMTKIDILQKSTQFIKEIRLTNSRLLMEKCQPQETGKKVKQLQDEVNKLIIRVKQLTQLLKEASITIPVGPAIKLLGTKKNKWAAKLIPSEEAENDNPAIKKVTNGSKKKGRLSKIATNKRKRSFVTDKANGSHKSNPVADNCSGSASENKAVCSHSKVLECEKESSVLASSQQNGQESGGNEENSSTKLGVQGSTIPTLAPAPCSSQNGEIPELAQTSETQALVAPKIPTISTTATVKKKPLANVAAPVTISLSSTLIPINISRQFTIPNLSMQPLQTSFIFTTPLTCSLPQSSLTSLGQHPMLTGISATISNCASSTNQANILPKFFVSSDNIQKIPIRCIRKPSPRKKYKPRGLSKKRIEKALEVQNAKKEIPPKPVSLDDKENQVCDDLLQQVRSPSPELIDISNETDGTEVIQGAKQIEPDKATDKHLEPLASVSFDSTHSEKSALKENNPEPSQPSLIGIPSPTAGPIIAISNASDKDQGKDSSTIGKINCEETLNENECMISKNKKEKVEKGKVNEEESSEDKQQEITSVEDTQPAEKNDPILESQTAGTSEEVPATSKESASKENEPPEISNLIPASDTPEETQPLKPSAEDASILQLKETITNVEKESRNCLNELTPISTSTLSKDGHVSSEKTSSSSTTYNTPLTDQNRSLTEADEDGLMNSDYKISECIARSIDLIDDHPTCSDLIELSTDWSVVVNSHSSAKSPMSPTQMFLSMFPLLPRESLGDNLLTHSHKAPIGLLTGTRFHNNFFIDSMLPEENSNPSASNSNPQGILESADSIPFSWTLAQAQSNALSTNQTKSGSSTSYQQRANKRAQDDTQQDFSKHHSLTQLKPSKISRTDEFSTHVGLTDGADSVAFPLLLPVPATSSESRLTESLPGPSQYLHGHQAYLMKDNQHNKTIDLCKQVRPTIPKSGQLQSKSNKNEGSKKGRQPSKSTKVFSDVNSLSKSQSHPQTGNGQTRNLQEASNNFSRQDDTRAKAHNRAFQPPSVDHQLEMSKSVCTAKSMNDGQNFYYQPSSQKVSQPSASCRTSSTSNHQHKISHGLEFQQKNQQNLNSTQINPSLTLNELNFSSNSTARSVQPTHVPEPEISFGSTPIVCLRQPSTDLPKFNSFDSHQTRASINLASPATRSKTSTDNKTSPNNGTKKLISMSSNPEQRLQNNYKSLQPLAVQNPQFVYNRSFESDIVEPSQPSPANLSQKHIRPFSSSSENNFAKSNSITQYSTRISYPIATSQSHAATSSNTQIGTSHHSPQISTAKSSTNYEVPKSVMCSSNSSQHQLPFYLPTTTINNSPGSLSFPLASLNSSNSSIPTVSHHASALHFPHNTNSLCNSSGSKSNDNRSQTQILFPQNQQGNFLQTHLSNSRNNFFSTQGTPTSDCQLTQLSSYNNNNSTDSNRDSMSTKPGNGSNNCTKVNYYEQQSSSLLPPYPVGMQEQPENPRHTSGTQSLHCSGNSNSNRCVNVGQNVNEFPQHRHFPTTVNWMTDPPATPTVVPVPVNHNYNTNSSISQLPSTGSKRSNRTSNSNNNHHNPFSVSTLVGSPVAASNNNYCAEALIRKNTSNWIDFSAAHSMVPHQETAPTFNLNSQPSNPYLNSSASSNNQNLHHQYQTPLPNQQYSTPHNQFNYFENSTDINQRQYNNNNTTTVLAPRPFHHHQNLVDHQIQNQCQQASTSVSNFNLSSIFPEINDKILINPNSSTATSNYNGKNNNSAGSGSSANNGSSNSSNNNQNNIVSQLQPVHSHQNPSTISSSNNNMNQMNNFNYFVNNLTPKLI